MTQVYGLGVRARLLARNGEATAALALAEQADGLAATSDSPRAQGNAALNLSEVLYLTGNPTRAQEMTRRAIEHYQRKGATAYTARAQRLAAAWASHRKPAPGIT